MRYQSTTMSPIPGGTVALNLAVGTGSLLQAIRLAEPGVPAYGLEGSSLLATTAQSHGLSVLVGPSPKLPAPFATSREFARRRLDGYDALHYRCLVALSRLARRTVSTTWRACTQGLATTPSPVFTLCQISRQAGFPGQPDAWDQCRYPVSQPVQLLPKPLAQRRGAGADAGRVPLCGRPAGGRPSPSGRLARTAALALPFKPGLLTLQLVTGSFDRPVGTAPRRHVVRGQVVRNLGVTKGIGEGGPVQVTTDRLAIEITTVNATGALRRFGSRPPEEGSYMPPICTPPWSKPKPGSSPGDGRPCSRVIPIRITPKPGATSRRCFTCGLHPGG